MKHLKVVLIVSGALLVLFYIARQDNKETFINTSTTTNVTSTTTNVNIEDFIIQNISILSPEKEVLGGKFYITKIQANNGTGTVEYEDGHIAFTADFTYQTDVAGKVSVVSFKIRK